MHGKHTEHAWEIPPLRILMKGRWYERRCIYSGRLHFCPKGRSRFRLGFIYMRIGKSPPMQITRCPRRRCTSFIVRLSLQLVHLTQKRKMKQERKTFCLLFLIYKPLQIAPACGTFHSRILFSDSVWLSLVRDTRDTCDCYSCYSFFKFPILKSIFIL